MNSFVNYILKKQKGKCQVIWWGHVKKGAKKFTLVSDFFKKNLVLEGLTLLL
jgi:trehalose utilization protein